MHVDLDMDFRLMWKEVSLSLQAYNSIYVFYIYMDFRLTWTLGIHGLHIDMDRGHIKFTRIQLQLRNIG